MSSPSICLCLTARLFNDQTNDQAPEVNPVEVTRHRRVQTAMSLDVTDIDDAVAQSSRIFSVTRKDDEANSLEGRGRPTAVMKADRYFCCGPLTDRREPRLHWPHYRPTPVRGCVALLRQSRYVMMEGREARQADR